VHKNKSKNLMFHKTRSTNTMPQINSKPKMMLSNASGFTLLEIIAVIVILSIIAVVAVPRYFDLQDQARKKTIQTALAEGIGRVNMHFAEALLTGSMPWQVDLRAAVIGTDMGDFILSTTDDAAGTDNKDDVIKEFEISVVGRPGTPLAGVTASRILPRPGL
jgi:prepilin-type N-terminal cleavage/methylation domain-containing protein